MKKDKLINGVLMLLQVIGLGLIIAFNDTNKVWVAFGGGLIISAMTVWVFLNPLVDDDEGDELNG